MSRSARFFFVSVIAASLMSCAATESEPAGAEVTVDTITQDLPSPEDTSTPTQPLEVELCAIDAEQPDGACTATEELDFGELYAGETVERSLFLENTGAVTGTVNEQSVPADFVSFWFQGPEDDAVDIEFPYDLTAETSATIRLSYTAPLESGAVEETFSFALLSESGEERLFEVTLRAAALGCPELTADCDLDLADACETDLTTVDACGACDVVCGVANGASVCEAGQCVNTCDTGWSGADCSVDIDECLADAGPCDVNASCANSEGGYTCVCNAGYAGDGSTCADIDECGAAVSPCDVNATCTNNMGAFECVCNAGYTGDGASCADVDECAAETSPCVANAECENTPGNFACTCISALSPPVVAAAVLWPLVVPAGLPPSAPPPHPRPTLVKKIKNSELYFCILSLNHLCLLEPTIPGEPNTVLQQNTDFYPERLVRLCLTVRVMPTWVVGEGGGAHSLEYSSERLAGEP